jgi:hypothetical protein
MLTHPKAFSKKHQDNVWANITLIDMVKLYNSCLHNHLLHISNGLWEISSVHFSEELLPLILTLAQINLSSYKLMLCFIISVTFITDRKMLKLYVECTKKSNRYYGHFSISSMLILLFCVTNKFWPFMNSVRSSHIL